MKKPLEKYGKLRYRENIVAFALSFFIWLFWWYFIPKMGGYGSDGSKYIQMAMGNYSDVPSPFRNRIFILDIPKKETLLKLKQQIQFKLSGK